MGNGFNELLSRVRISRACDLLVQTNQPVTNICVEIGFNHVANFHRRFRRIKDITPGEYREQAQQRLRKVN